jgi:N12 class adenine-specific DNA methylase
MRQDVVGPARKVESVTSAEEGLLVCLNERGKVDIDHIARLYASTSDVVLAELGELLYQDPATGDYETRDAYLSGNVRRKLADAKASGKHQRNVAALEAVQPEDLLPGDIDANLGAPWLPVSDLEAFAVDLFQVTPSAISVAHLPKDAIWTVDATYEAKSAVTNTSEYGTPRIDGLTLFEHALNLKSPSIYDEIRDGDSTKRVLNQEATIAAREKQKRIKQRFASWVFGDPERRLQQYQAEAVRRRASRFSGDEPSLQAAQAPDRCGLAHHVERQYAPGTRGRRGQNGRDVHRGDEAQTDRLGAQVAPCRAEPHA